VVSNSLQAAEWGDTEIISGDVAQRQTDLKAQDGGDIAMSGSPTTVRWLLREGVVDELNLLVHPIAVGQGLARLFPTDEPSIPLELVSAETSKTGVLSLRSVTPRFHRPAGPDRPARRPSAAVRLRVRDRRRRDLMWARWPVHWTVRVPRMPRLVWVGMRQ
jgi:hypothetical protein